MSDVIGKARKEIESFENDSVKVTGDYSFHQLQTIQKIDLYYASRFVKGNTDTDGFKKLFFNIVKHRVNAATKAIDLDTKNVRVIADDDRSYFAAWFLEKELRQFMKEEKFGQLFNEIAQKLPRYGTVVIKDVNGSPKIVPLQNLVLDPTIDRIKRSPYILERHRFTLDEYREIAVKKGWEDTDEVVRMYELAGIPEIEVVERYGYMKESELDETSDKQDLVRAHAVITGLEFFEDYETGKLVADDKDKRFKPMVVSKMEVDEWPYKDLHWDKEHGRYLGVGVVEDLFINQESMNEVKNLLRKGLYWGSKKLFQTRDQKAPRNLFTRVQNGDVFTLQNEINPVAMEERNLPQYNLEMQSLDQNSDQRAFSFEVNTGEALPSGTPFRLGAILANAVNTHFAVKREDFGMFIQEIIFEFVLPSFQKRKRKEHIFGFDGSGEELRQVQQLLATSHLQRAIEKFFKKTGRYPTLDEYDREKQKIVSKLASKDKLFLNLPDGFYDDAKFKIDIVTTGEQVDTAQEIETLSTYLTAVSTNPGLLDDPRTRGPLERILNLAGQAPAGLKTQAPAQGVPQFGVGGNPAAVQGGSAPQFNQGGAGAQVERFAQGEQI